MSRRNRRGIMSEEFKSELAKDLGFYETVQREGWGGIRTKDAGNMVKRAIQIAEQTLKQQQGQAPVQTPQAYTQPQVQPYTATYTQPQVPQAQPYTASYTPSYSQPAASVYSGHPYPQAGTAPGQAFGYIPLGQPAIYESRQQPGR